MLNKNQSKKWNSWKYVLIAPALAAFMFYFQVKVIAQERETAEVTPTMLKTVEIKLNKNTTDAQLKAYSNEFKEQFGAKLKFSKVKRNSAGEITEIKVQYDDKKGKTGSWHVREDKPINSLRLSRKDDGSIAFGGDKQIRIVTHNDDESADVETDTTFHGNKTYKYSYSYSDGEDGDGPVVIVNGEQIPLPPDPPTLAEIEKIKADVRNNINIKTVTNKDGKISVTVNGEMIDIDTDMILADLDISLDELKEQAQAGAKIAREQSRMARKQAERAHRQSERSRERAGEAANDSEETRLEMEQTRRELEQTRREMEEARLELSKAREAWSKEKAAYKSKTKSSKNK